MINVMTTRDRLLKKASSYEKMNKMINQIIEECFKGAEKGDIGRVFHHAQDTLEKVHIEEVITILREVHNLDVISYVEKDSWFLEVRWQ